MKVIEKIELKDGTPVQLEDWRENNTTEYPDLHGYVIAAYPIAKATVGQWYRKGERFRLSISTNKFTNYTEQNTLDDFEALKNSSKKLSDLAPHFDKKRNDRELLGLKTKNYAVIERYTDESLSLVVLNDSDEVEYIRHGYENMPRGTLRSCVESIENGADPAAEWDGNELHAAEIEHPEKFESWFSDDCNPDEWRDIVYNGEYNYYLMGEAGIREFYAANDAIRQSISDNMIFYLNDILFSGMDFYPREKRGISRVCCDVNDDGIVTDIRIYYCGDVEQASDFHGESIDITEAVENFAERHNPDELVWHELIEDIYQCIANQRIPEE